MNPSTTANRHPVRRDRGAVIPIVGLLLPVLLLMTAFAVDLGQQRSSRRTMQARADVIALDMVRLADGRTTDEIWDHSTTTARLLESANNNEIDPAKIVEVVWGEYDETVQPLPFVPHHVHGAPPADNTLVPDAVLITTTETTDYRFRPGSGTVTRSAVAGLGERAHAANLLGSTLVSITPPTNWIIGQTLQQIIPGADLIGYQGLANASITLDSLATNLGLGSADELADATVTFEDLLIASAAALQAPDATGDDQAAAVQVMDDLLALGVGDFDVQMGEVLGLGTMDPDAGLAGSVSISQLLFSSVAVANGVNAISMPATVLNVAGLAGLTMDLSAIEAPIRIGDDHEDDGTTKQFDVGISIDLDIDGDKTQDRCDLPSDERSVLALLLGLVDSLICTLGGSLLEPLGVDIEGTIDLDLTLGAIYGQQFIDCASSRLNVDYDTEPGSVIVNSSLGIAVTYDGKPLDLLAISSPSPVPVTIDGSSGSVSFQPTDAGPHHLAFEQVFGDGSTGGSSAPIGAPNLGLTSVIPSSGIQVTVANEDLPVLGGIASNLVVPVLNDILQEVDNQVVAELSKLLGANFGGGDITPQFMLCDDSAVRLVG